MAKKVTLAKSAAGNETRDEVPIDDLDAEAIRFRSTLEQVEADLEAGQVVTARDRIRAALIHGQEPEPEPLE